MQREKIITEFKNKKNSARMQEFLFANLSGMLGQNLYPVEAYQNGGGSVKRGNKELKFIDVRIYFEESQF